MSVLQRIYNALPAFGSAVAILAAIFAVFAYFVGIETKTPTAWVLVAGSIPLAFCVMLGDMLSQAIGEVHVRLPRIIRHLSLQGEQPYPRLFLVEPSPLFGQGMSASIYSMEDGFEILVAEGYVLTVQQDARIQIAVTRLLDGTEEIWRQLTENSPDSLRRTLVRPGNQWQGT